MSTDTMAETAPTREQLGLNSPPDSNSAPKDSGSDSELSELQPDNDLDELFGIEPAEWSDGDSGVPIFRPSMAEFADFEKYMEAINHYGMASGIVKVIPPAEWLALQPPYIDPIKTVTFRQPMNQTFQGTIGGVYRQDNTSHFRTYNLVQWREFCDQPEHQPPAKRGEVRANQEKSAPAARSRGSRTASSNAQKKKGKGKAQKGKSKARATDGEDAPSRLITPVSPDMDVAIDPESVGLEADVEEEISAPVRRSSEAKVTSVSSRRKNNKREIGIIDEAVFKDFKYDLEGQDFSKERCDELERTYWRTLTYAPTFYGGDVPGTLFTSNTKTWNLDNLPSLLDVLDQKIPGVNTAYLYLGMWKATFSWHLEDVDLYSINYLHFGAPKQWYAIAQKDLKTFERAMRDFFPEHYRECDQFLRHKSFVASPSALLSRYGIKVNKIVHHPGEFIITFPFGYHSGYNLGYNCAEAVNFALESWKEIGRNAKRCECDRAQDSVWIDMRDIERAQAKKNGEEWETDFESEEDEEEEMEEVESHIPQAKGVTINQKPRSQKRKRPTTEKGSAHGTKRIRIRIKAPSKEPCVLCPNDIPSEPLLPTEDGQRAHRMCAEYCPDTWIESETVMGVKQIQKARLELRCLFCKSKKGACFQCGYSKCVRPYHATCAAAAGVYVEQGETAGWNDGVEYSKWGIDYRCRFHRVKRDKKFDGDALEDNERITNAAASLKVGDVCQFQYYRGDIFAGTVVENRKSERMVLVDILPKGDRIEVAHKWLLIPDSADSLLQKPSANAIPWTKSLSDSLSLSKRHAGDLPRKHDPFVTGFTWEEFNHEEIPRNPDQVPVELTKADPQVWHYLGKTSTEAKAQFTEDPAKPQHNLKGDFLRANPRSSNTSRSTNASSRGSLPGSYRSNSQSTPYVWNRPNPPSQPSHIPHSYQPVSTRVEKPYSYKPKFNGESRADQQLYQSQQQPPLYRFGSDPQWQSRDSKPVNSYASQPYRPASTYSPAPQYLPASSVQANAKPQATSEMAPPRQPTQPQEPVKKNNPFKAKPPLSETAATSTKPRAPRYDTPQQWYNPFVKYPYLQKQHNRARTTYKSPYRIGGGFMNGYEGDATKHFQQLFSQNPTGVNKVLPGSSPSSSATAGSNVPPTHSSTSNTSYAISNSGASSQKYTPIHTPNLWEKRESTKLHPAIRQEYNKMSTERYQPSQPLRASPYQAPRSDPAVGATQGSQYPRSGPASGTSWGGPSRNGSSPGAPPYQPLMQPPSMYGRPAALPIPNHQLRQPSQAQAPAQPTHTALNSATAPLSRPSFEHNSSHFQHETPRATTNATGIPSVPSPADRLPYQPLPPPSHQEKQLQPRHENGQRPDLPEVEPNYTQTVENLLGNLKRRADEMEK